MAARNRLRPHYAVWVSALLILATLALFVSGLFELTALNVLLLLAFMPGVRSGLNAGRRPADDVRPCAGGRAPGSEMPLLPKEG